MASSQLSREPPESPDGSEDGAVGDGYDAETLLELLGDEYTQRVLAAIGDSTRTGTELIERAGVSKATAYRRLDDLQKAGIVESSMRIDPEGHHCEQYELAVSQLAISFGPDGFDVLVDPEERAQAGDQTVQMVVPADD